MRVGRDHASRDGDGGDPTRDGAGDAASRTRERGYVILEPV